MMPFGQMLKEKMGNLQLSCLMDAEIISCFFHISQTIYRKLVELGYEGKYRDVQDFSI